MELDIPIAAYAIVNDATVLAADHGFDLIATLTDLKHEYIAPPSMMPGIASQT